MSSDVPSPADVPSSALSSRQSTPDDSTKRDRRVSFDSVIIREYNRVIGKLLYIGHSLHTYITRVNDTCTHITFGLPIR